MACASKVPDQTPSPAIGTVSGIVSTADHGTL